jgi:hypothetical protein
MATTANSPVSSRDLSSKKKDIPSTVLVSQPLLTALRYKTYAFDNLKLSKPYAKKDMKQAVIAPSMLYLLYPLDGTVEGYPKTEFVKDLVNEVRYLPHPYFQPI